MPRKLYLRNFTGKEAPLSAMRNIGVCEDGIRIMAPKTSHYSFLYKELDPRGANILKQEMLAAGAEAAISYEAMSDWTKPTDVFFTGTERQLRIVLGKLDRQPFGLKRLGEEMGEAISILADQPRGVLRIGKNNLELGLSTLIMGVLNVTPDSFYDGGDFIDPERATARAREMVEQGADIIDIGGESTRPGAETVTVEDELERVIPVIRSLKGEGFPMSIDTRKPEVAAKALEAGAGMVNLVGGFRDREMVELLAKVNVPVTLMHMRGEPGNMQDGPEYADVMDEIVLELSRQIETGIEGGVAASNIIVDPGIGFGKTVEHNLEILKRLTELRILGMPIMIGASRKSFIGKLTGMEVDDRLEGSLASAVIAAVNGADIVRVHDVAETKRALAVTNAILSHRGDKYK